MHISLNIDHEHADGESADILHPMNPLRAANMPPRLTPLPDDAIQQNQTGLGGAGEFVNALQLFTTFFG